MEIVRRAFALANAGEWDTVIAIYHSDVEFRNLRPTPDTPEVLRGRDGVRRVLALWTGIYDEFGADVDEYVDADPWVICDTRWHGRVKGSDVPIANHVADAYKIKDGKIARAIMSYPDVATALDAVGLTG